MQAYKASSVFECFFTIGRLTLIGMAVVAAVASARGRETTSNARIDHHEWHKYVNQQYGFSFWYPDTYQAVPPADTDGRCIQSENYKCLLWLALRNDPDTTIIVTLYPYRLHPGSAEVMPTRQRIGHHAFYCGIVGSMGVGYSDFCIFKLKGKALEFQFSPSASMNPSEKADSLVTKMLETFRTF